jgi:hypothetical protein
MEGSAMTDQSADDRGIEASKNAFEADDTQEASSGNEENPDDGASVIRRGEDRPYGSDDDMRASYSADPGGPV